MAAWRDGDATAARRRREGTRDGGEMERASRGAEKEVSEGWSDVASRLLVPSSSSTVLAWTLRCEI